MKLRLVILAAVPGILAAIVDTERDLICASDNDCYPKVLIPTEEWQQIREGQDIPQGLHVRLNIDTLVKEAKILDEDDEEGMSKHNFSDLVAVPQEEKEEEEEDRSITPPTGQINSFTAAVEEVNYGKDESRLAQALDVLVDISHDAEFGEKLTANKQPFSQLFKLVNKHQDNLDMVEIIYRIIGTSLRNNQEAIKNFLKVQDQYVIDQLLQQITNPNFNDIIQKRILGIIQALLQNDTFRFTYFKIDQLITKYDYLGDQSKLRFLNILQDLGYNSKDIEKRSDNDSDSTFSNYLQNALINDKITPNSQFKALFDQLTKLHEDNQSLRVSTDFLQWLSDEVESRKRNDKREEHEVVYDQEMLRRRHEVFGNPNAMRKAMLDEL